MVFKSIGRRIVTCYQRREAFFATATLLLLGLIAYAPLMSKFGFYRDDWYMLWTGRAFGPPGIVDLFTFDRPFVGFVYSISYRLLGENPLSWQIYSFTIRAIGALAFLWLLRRLWPEHKLETTSAAIIFFIYPGFLQWANANTKSNHLTTLSLAILSICLTVAAFQTRKLRRKTIFASLALITAAGYWFLYEYMIGLEGLRIMVVALFIWREDSQSRKSALLRFLRMMLPYFILMALYVTWRLFVFQSGRAGVSVESAFEPYQLSLLRTVANRAIVLVEDIFETVVSAWAVPINSFTFNLKPAEFIITALLTLLAIGIFTIYTLSVLRGDLARRVDRNERDNFLSWVLIGAIAVVMTLAPVVVVGRDVRWDSGFDKYTLQASAGVALLLVGTISFLVKSRYRFVLIAFLIAIATATQYGNSARWSTFWDDQRELWWQLSWRAPSLKEGTVLLVEMPGERFFEDYEIWGPANLIYDPGEPTVRIQSEILSSSTLEKIRVGQTESWGLRDTVESSRSYLNSLILSRPERTSCWHAMDGDDPVFPGQTSPMLYSIIRLSQINQIDIDAPMTLPPEDIFGREPEHDWCYFFETASLEAQRSNWNRVVELGDRALSLGFKPIDRSEWLPFLKGFVMVGREADAEEMALWIRDNEVIRHRQCDYMNNGALPDSDRQAYFKAILCQ